MVPSQAWIMEMRKYVLVVLFPYINILLKGAHCAVDKVIGAKS